MRNPTKRLRWSLPLIAIGLSGALVAGCSDATSSGDESAANDPYSESSDAAVAPREISVPAGTVMAVTFDRTVSSADSQAGDRFSASLVDPIVVDGEVAVEAGARVLGRVVEARPAKKIGGAALLNLEFTALERSSGEQLPLSASFGEQAKSQRKKDAATIGGATAGGAILGRIIGHNNENEADGTAIGAVVGAAVGTAIAASNTGEEVTIHDGLTVHLVLEAPLKVDA